MPGILAQRRRLDLSRAKHGEEETERRCVLAAVALAKLDDLPSDGRPFQLAAAEDGDVDALVRTEFAAVPAEYAKVNHRYTSGHHLSGLFYHRI